MASTYSTSLKLELIGQGEQSGTWGVTTNNNFGNLVEQAITGVQTISMSNATYTLTNYDGTLDEARNAVLVVGGTNIAGQNLIAPSVEKLYTLRNISGANVTIKTSSGNGVIVTNNAYAQVYCDGVDFFNATPSVNSITGDLAVSGNETVGGNLTVAGSITAGSIVGLGKTIRNIVPVQSYTSYTTTSSSYTFTGHSASITPSSTSSKIMVLFYGGLSQTQYMGPENYALLNLYRNGSSVGAYQSINVGVLGQQTAILGSSVSFAFVDSPATTAAVTYGIYTAIAGSAPVTAVYNGPGGATITLLEIL
jgi:hypothetical protein